MTAGRGIVHSERTAPEVRQHSSPVFGLQCWVALPRAQEEIDPDFRHIGLMELPELDDTGLKVRIVAGSFYNRRSPAPTLSDLFQVDATLQPGAKLEVPAEYPEQAIYIAQGSIDLGSDGVFDAGQLLVLKPGRAVTLKATGPDTARLALLGGEPMDGPRYLSWNFVSSSAE